MQNFPRQLAMQSCVLCSFVIYLGEGAWWREDEYGVEFLDATSNPDYHTRGPEMKHYRSSNLKDTEFSLLQVIEKCENENIKLPFYDEK